MKMKFPAAAAAALALVGCGGDSSETAELSVPGQPVYEVKALSAAEIAANEPPPPVPGEPVQPVAPVRSYFDGKEASEVVSDLTAILKSFHAEMQKVPASLEELVTLGFLDKAPVAPEGHAYVIVAESLEVNLRRL
jgi:hypothetical protein